MSEFYQDGPQLANQWRDDSLLRDYLGWRMPEEIWRNVQPGLDKLGARVAGDILQLAQAATAAPPWLRSHDAWGQRVDQIVVSDAWRGLHAVAAQEGMVATGYERREGQWSRLHQFARLYLFNPSSAIYTCPLAMTDGAARILELHGDRRMRYGVLPHLLSRDPAQFWTSGQWMTERSGGSDVSGTATIARQGKEGYRLYGSKWFTSAADSQIALTLARVGDATELSLFYLETHAPDGGWNGIRVGRLKDKLGTRAMATAELELDGTRASLIGEPGEGVRRIATMLNVTRGYNAISAVSFMRRGLALARDYARRREVFGKPLAEQPLHRETLAQLAVEQHAAFHLAFHLGWLMGNCETGSATDDDKALLRLLTPVVKLYTGKQVVAACSETLECFGGAGYVEDTGLPALLRDAQVLSIWEGTTNVLSLDVLRVLGSGDALAVWRAAIGRSVASAGRRSALQGATEKTVAAADDLLKLRERQDADPGLARAFSFGIARVQAAALLLEFAAAMATAPGAALYAAAALRWCSAELLPWPLRCGDDRGQSSLALGE